MKLLLTSFFISVINIVTLSQAQNLEKDVTNLFLNKAVLNSPNNKLPNKINSQFYIAQKHAKWASENEQNAFRILMKLFHHKFNITMKHIEANKHYKSLQTATKTAIPGNNYKMPFAHLFQHKIISSEPQTRNNKYLRSYLPSQVAIFSWPAKENDVPMCGGSLISNRFVLTTANCVADEIRVELIFGANKIQNSEPTQVKMKSSYFIIHKKWNQTTFENNIALIKLPQEMEFNEHIFPANLPLKTDEQKTFTDHYATVIGWSTNRSKPGIAMAMNTTDVIISNDKCFLTYSWYIPQSCICLDGSMSNASCVGESGDQLIVKDEDGTTKLIGLLSFGMLDGCQRKQPVVFTRVTSYLSWIQNHVNS